MRKILPASIFILTFCAFAFGQNTNCPTISVTGPASVIQPGETATFTANVTGELDGSKLEYVWSVDKGKIIEGQGTQVVTISTEGLEDVTITATVEVKGLPVGCPNTDSETSVPYCAISPILFDEFKVSSQPIDSEMLDAYVSELEINPQDEGYIIIYSNKNFPLSEIKRKESFIKNYLVKKKIAEDRITFIIDRNSEDIAENRIRFWRVPPGAEPPLP